MYVPAVRGRRGNPLHRQRAATRRARPRYSIPRRTPRSRSMRPGTSSTSRTDRRCRPTTPPPGPRSRPSEKTGMRNRRNRCRRCHRHRLPLDELHNRDSRMEGRRRPRRDHGRSDRQLAGLRIGRHLPEVEKSPIANSNSVKPPPTARAALQPRSAIQLRIRLWSPPNSKKISKARGHLPLPAGRLKCQWNLPRGRQDDHPAQRETADHRASLRTDRRLSVGLWDV